MRRINTARWVDSKKMWRIDVQKDGVRKSFYCSTPGRNGQREANRKADAWLESDIISLSVRTNALLDEYLERVKATTSKSNYRKETYHVEHFIRPGELCGLRPEDCQPGKVIIRRSINSDGEETKGKNENAIRPVILSPLAEAELTAQLRELPGDGTVFGLRSESYYRKRWTVFCDANDISYVSPYELRHTFVSVVKNLPEGEVKALGGHSRNMDTFGTYGHELDGEQNQMAIRVVSLFLGLLKRQGKG